MSKDKRPSGRDDYEWIKQEAAVLAVRLSLAQAFVQMLQTAYDALLTHNVNYRNLPTWQDSAVLDEANKVPIERGQVLILDWITRMESDVRAAVRRKGMKLI